jgi:hypothetical protein
MNDVAPVQLELPFPVRGEFHFATGDLVMFASTSGKWNHLRKIIEVDQRTGVLHTVSVEGAIHVGRPDETVLMRNVLGHWIPAGESR